MENINFKTLNGGYYALMIEGQEIGTVYEREHAEMIEEATNKRRIDKLEKNLEASEKDIENMELQAKTDALTIDSLKQTVEAYRMTLEKIYNISNSPGGTGDATTSLFKIHNLSSITKTAKDEQTK